jgi:predicted nucleotidyltransferase
MDQKDILDALGEYKNQFAEKYGILSIGIFGSLARNEDREDSDVDVIIRLAKPELFTLAGIKQDLEDRFNKPVDIVTYREKMNSFLKKRIDKEAVYV